MEDLSLLFLMKACPDEMQALPSVSYVSDTEQLHTPLHWALNRIRPEIPIKHLLWRTSASLFDVALLPFCGIRLIHSRCLERSPLDPNISLLYWSDLTGTSQTITSHESSLTAVDGSLYYAILYHRRKTAIAMVADWRIAHQPMVLLCSIQFEISIVLTVL